MVRDYLIYKNGKEISLTEALAIDTDVAGLVYVQSGKRNKNNPRWVIAVLEYLQTHNEIDSFAYVGLELKQLDIDPDLVY
jgi:hypothetical protein